MTHSRSDGLEAPALRPLPLGAITPRGWLERQLEVQAEGLTGHLDEFWDDLADNQWLGGRYDGWERGPYYADGVVPLAYLLDDDDLIRKAEKWVEGFLDSQHEDGFIGPVDHERSQGYERDPWPRFVVCKVLRQHYEATDDERSLAALVDFCEWLDGYLQDNQLESWGRFRWADMVVTVYWLYDQTGDESLLGLADTLIDHGFDWEAHFEALSGYTSPVPTAEHLDSHVVNNAMGVKSPTVKARRQGDGERDSLDAIDVLDKFHGQATGLFSGDEHLAGRNPSRGTELCAVVEYMYSLEKAIAILGDAALGDRLERIAYNALPAGLTPDMCAHQYDQQANQVLCDVSEREWTNGPDANIFGVAPHFGCCTSNFHQGWPKFVSHTWMRTDDGLAVTAYAPTELSTTVDDTAVAIVEDTEYPFEDTVRFEVDPEESVAFELSVRIPEWADGVTVNTPDGERRVDDESGYVSIDRTWTGDETVTVTFENPIRAERRYRGGVVIHRGPLTFAMPVAASEKRIGGDAPFHDRELYPDEPWNVGLTAAITEPEAVDVSEGSRDIGAIPFDPAAPPLTIEVPGQLVPDWGLDAENNWPAKIPNSPVRTETAEESVTLVPYGATNLRVTEFPLVE